MIVMNKAIHILEVDTSDADKSLSTQVIKTKDLENWDSDLKELEKLLIKSSLCWPRKRLRWVFGEGQFKGIPHPKTDSKNKGVLSPDFMAKWADRLYTRISTL